MKLGYWRRFTRRASEGGWPSQPSGGLKLKPRPTFQFYRGWAAQKPIDWSTLAWPGLRTKSQHALNKAQILVYDYILLIHNILNICPKCTARVSIFIHFTLIAFPITCNNNVFNLFIHVNIWTCWKLLNFGLNIAFWFQPKRRPVDHVWRHFAALPLLIKLDLRGCVWNPGKYGGKCEEKEIG